MTTKTKKAVMTTQEVADRLVELCREGKFTQAVKELYAPEVESHEPIGAHGPAHSKGFDAVLNKTEQFGMGIEEVHMNKVSDPIVADNFFSVGMWMDVTMKGMGRIKMEEVALYHVVDGKVVSDRFYYTPPPAQN
ncbi:MAG TPA: nuclear transport factor 2 family protein [Flavobacteriales bacterium]|nr:nuclear transport factor 2 family protein [Flavobacteriales bacterium]